MRAAEVRFQDLLNGKIQYRVPLFQRTYSWDEDNWRRLWDDLVELYDLSELRSHFLGAVVTLPLPGNPADATKYMLIDGQQRFTTLLILLAVIRDTAAKAGGDLDSLSSQIDAECLTNPYALNPDERLKLKPTQQDAKHLEALLGGGSARLDASRVRDARDFFIERVREGDLNGEPFDLRRLKSCVTDYLSLVSINLDQQDSPHRIFESLNNTGEPLTASDLVRNHIFMRIPDEDGQARAYREHWYPMQARMEIGDGGSGMTDFLWRYLMMLGELPRYDEVFEGMRDQIERRVDKGGESMFEVLQDLDRMSTLYHRIWRPDLADQDRELASQLGRLNEWEVSVAYPFMLKALDLHDRHPESVAQEDVLTVFGMIESFVTRRLIAGIPTNRLRRIFARMATAAESSGFVERSRSQLLANDWPTDDVFRERFQTVPIYLTARVGRVRQILIALERSYEDRERIELTDRMTVEHVMPQTMSSSWEEYLGAEAARVHETYLHTIGNLTLSAYNIEMGNQPYDKKRRVLADSKFALNRLIAQAETWGEAAIRRRAEELADRAVTVWPRGEAGPVDEDVFLSVTVDTTEAWTDVTALASATEIEEELNLLVERAESAGLVARPDRHSVMFVSPSDRRVMLFTVWPQASGGGSFRLWISPEAFQRYYPFLSEHQIIEALGTGGRPHVLSATDVVAYADRLHLLLKGSPLE